MWLQFLDSFIGRSFFQKEFVQAANFELFMEATGSRDFVQFCASIGVVVSGLSPGFIIQLLLLLELFAVIIYLEIWGNFFC